MLEAVAAPLSWDHPDLLASLTLMNEDQLDRQPWGVIRFDASFAINGYNQHECESTGLRKDQVLGKHVFTRVAQCMNNFMVAQKFEDAMAQQAALDHTLDYVLTWRMKPTPVKLRLLWDPMTVSGYLLLQRTA